MYPKVKNSLALKTILKRGIILIKSFTCRNFRNISVVELEFGRINILIGPNNAGKSNFIRALSFCANMINNPSRETSGFLAEVQRNGMEGIVNRRDNSPQVDFSWRIALKNEEVKYSFSFNTGNTIEEFYIRNERVDGAKPSKGQDREFNFFNCHEGKRGEGIFSTTRHMGKKNSRKHIFVRDDETVLQQFNELVITNGNLLREKYVRNEMFTMLAEMREYFSKFYSYSSSRFDFDLIRQLRDPRSDGRVLEKDGANFANVYNRLLMTDEDFSIRFIKRVREIMPDVKAVNVVEGLEKIGIQIEKGDEVFMLAEMSDGTVEALLLALLISLPKEISPTLLAIDEPEVNLHPAWQKSLARWLQMSDSFNQCFISTHSSDFLDSFTEGFRNGMVDIFVYDGDGENTFRKLDRSRVLPELEEGWLLGDLYRVNDPAIGGWPW